MLMMKKLLINAIRQEKIKKEAEIKRMRDNALAMANPGMKVKKKKSEKVVSDHEVNSEEEKRLGEEAEKRQDELLKSLDDQASKSSKECDMDFFELEPPPAFVPVGRNDLHLEKVDPRIAVQPLDIFKQEELETKLGVKYRENGKVYYGGDFVEQKMKETGRLTREAYFFKAVSSRKVGPEPRQHLQT